MAFNRAVFRTRTISAIVFVAIMLVGLLHSLLSFVLLFTIVHIGCWWEYIRMQQHLQRCIVSPWLAAGLLLWGSALMLWLGGIGWGIMWSQMPIPMYVLLFLAGIPTMLSVFWWPQWRAIAGLALGWLYISVPWGCMLWLRSKGEAGWLPGIGWLLPMLVVGSIWVNDTMAYIVGSWVGKTPLTAISPNKTWEGTLGGALLAMLVVGLLANVVWHVGLHFAIAIPLICAVAGTLGDLLESKLKRMAGVKDSGRMMPGHGGFLDRFDSLLLASPAVCIYIYCMQ